ncbi:MAG: transporter [Firmicutes bacterium]|nr:transporter [Bacillota bacterium]
MDFTTVMNQVVMIFLIMLVGVWCTKQKILNQEINKGLCDLLINITIPCTIISSFNQELSSRALIEAVYVLIFAFVSHSLSILIGYILYRKYQPPIRKVLWFITMFSNCGFMGFPLLESVFGKIGIFYGSVYLGVANLFTWTFGQIIFTGKHDVNSLKKALLNPGITAIFIGVVIFFSPVKPPVAVIKVIDMIGLLTTPLAMIIIGVMLAEVNYKELLCGWHIYYGTAVRLLLMPILTIVTLKSLGVGGAVLGVCMMVTAMPAASITVIFAEMFDGDAIFASKIVVVSTALSIITIPLMTLLL